MKQPGSAMRALLPVCAGIAVVSCIVSVSLWRDLREERLQTADLRAQLVNTSAAIGPSIPPALQQIIVDDVAPATVPAAEAPAGETGVADAKSVRAALPAAVRYEDVAPDLWKDPEYRRHALSSERRHMANTYRGLAEELGMSKEEFNRLLDLLAENQVASETERSVLSNEAFESDEGWLEAKQRLPAIAAEQEASVRFLLGDARYAKFKEFRDYRPARGQAATIAGQLADAGLPLTDTQKRSLTTAMIAQMKREESTEPQTTVDVMDSGSPDDPNWAVDPFTRYQEEKERRRIDAAAPHLTSRQVAVLREQMEEKAAIERIIARYLKGRARAEGNSR